MSIEISRAAALWFAVSTVSAFYFTLFQKKRLQKLGRTQKPALKRSPSRLDSTYNTIEFCISDVESALAAIHGGATSLELCANRLEGGVTPSIGLVEEVVKICRNFSVDVHVLVRPRPGGFVYSLEEFEVILRDVTAMHAAGADGVVCGILTSDLQVDEVRMRAIRHACSGMLLTFHRAFDLCADDRDQAMQSILKLGCDRLLTSGQHGTAPEGVDVLRELQHQYGTQVKIIAAAGLQASNVQDLISRSRVRGIHIGSGVDDWRECVQGSGAVFQDMRQWRGAEPSKVDEIVDKCFAAWRACADC